MYEKIISITISSILLIISSMYIWKKINNRKIIYPKIYIIFTVIWAVIIVTLNNLFVGNYIKPMISTLSIILLFYFLYKDHIKKCIILPIYSQLIIILSEVICVLILLFVSKVSDNMFAETFSGQILTNFIVAFISILIVNCKTAIKVYNHIISVTELIREYRLIIISIVLIIIANILTSFVYFKVNLILLLIINSSIIIIYTIFIFLYLKTQNNYVKVYDKYNLTLNSLKEYEDILSRYRISSHENKNQLLTIRGMANNKKISSYIDEIIENKIKDNEKLMFESLIIPEGGLRGLIYSKMLLMKENNIDYELGIDKQIKTTTITELSEELVLNICNIVGVYLDNAIEAVKNLKEKYIIIEMYLDETLNIAITNNYESSIDMEKIDNIGYTTKGNNHGYGLSLVKEIIDNNKDISNVRRITDNEFTQEIRINIKK